MKIFHLFKGITNFIDAFRNFNINSCSVIFHQFSGFNHKLLSYAENGVPKKDGEANFNRDTGTPYAVLEDGMVVVMIDNEWIEFKAK